MLENLGITSITKYINVVQSLLNQHIKNNVN